LQELSFDTLKSQKALEVTMPATLQMILPQDYVNYTKISWVDSAGIKHPIYPTSKTSNPSFNPLQNSDGDFLRTAVGNLNSSSSNIVLDKEYKGILVGMRVFAEPYIPSNAFVTAVSNDSGITTITIGSSDGTVSFLPTQSNNGTTLTFINSQLAIPAQGKSYHIVENLDWNTTDYKITANSAGDIDSIKVGMTISHDNFPAGTTVSNVFETTIVVNQLPDTAAISNSGEITFVSPELEDSDTWANYKSSTPSENNNDDYEDDTYWPNQGGRYGLDPQHAQVNGSFYIDDIAGKIHFSSNISGKTVILDYISDSVGIDAEMLVHKFAEEAMYKCIAHAILSTSSYGQQLVRRLTKEKFAAVRLAKLRLSNLKLEELTQILRGKSKQIKH